MHHYWYILALLLAWAGVLLSDYRLKLVLFSRPRFYGKVLLAAVGFFLSWDIAGLALKVFSTNQFWVTGLHVVSPNLPVEEFLFLGFFSYITLVVWEVVCSRTS